MEKNNWRTFNPKSKKNKHVKFNPDREFIESASAKYFQEGGKITTLNPFTSGVIVTGQDVYESLKGNI